MVALDRPSVEDTRKAQEVRETVPGQMLVFPKRHRGTLARPLRLVQIFSRAELAHGCAYGM